MDGKTIRIFLVDGVATGILTAEIINWSGKVIVAPRAQLSALAKREEAKRTGVYCLAGPDPDNTARDMIYVGEGDNVLKRVATHDNSESKDFWTRCALVISKDHNLTKAHVRYLESRMIGMGNLAGRAAMTNGTTPALPPLPEPDVDDMEYFLGQIQMMLPVLGFGFLQPKPTVSQTSVGETGDASPLFTMTAVGATATAQEIGGEFIVLRGSKARKTGPKNWTSYKALRDQLITDGKLADGTESDFYVFTEDVAFSSPSAGAAVVNAGNMNGRTAWKVAETGDTYQSWHEQKLAASGADADESD